MSGKNVATRIAKESLRAPVRTSVDGRRQIPRSSILRSLDVLHGQLVVDDQRGDAFNAAGSPRGARREASP